MKKKAFTLVELLVVISIIALLLSILMPSLSLARSQAKAVVCKSNLRQLALANIGYATENDEHYVPAASDMMTTNYHRWHGLRDPNNLNTPFDPLKSPLADYIGDGEVKECTEKIKFVKGLAWSANFEQGGGGYGYNLTYIGSKLWRLGWSNKAYQETAKTTDVSRTAETIMFADSAMANQNNIIGTYIHEYSFVEPPYFLSNGNPMPSWGYASPSIHFRHRGKADVVWIDGHTSSAERTNFNLKNGYNVKSADFNLGWFGLLNNSLFDLK